MQKTYFELSVHPSSHCELFSDFLLSFFDAVEEDGGALIVRSEEPLEVIKFGLEEFAKGLSAKFGENVSVESVLNEKANEDWIKKYQNGVEPVQVGNIYVRPSWVEPNPYSVDVLIDPALAFGSGHHESTYGCLLMIQRYVGIGSRFLDVGTGSGILAIAASKLGAICDICDTDPQALEAATANFAQNSVKYKNSWVGSVQDAPLEYGVIAANIIADVLLMIDTDLIKALREEGILILSGILDKYVPRIKSQYGSLSLIDEFNGGEWHTLVYKR